ncbi:PAS domain S-box protein [Leucothrix mucor]|uniref:PAS domain S-box protein n=1 Tax=Leucothrix mucor TaxID=45248 RepID=UPI00146B28F1|nr:PAS domain S-box protein [Leucothrix mucor]
MSKSKTESTLGNTADHSLRVRKLEQQLQESKKLQYSLLDGSIEGVLIHRNWKPLYLNKSLLNMLGYDSYTEVLAMDSVAPLIAEHERERLMIYTQARAKGEAAPTEYEFQALHRDGTLRCMEIKSSLIDWRGKPATFSTLINITERKRAQQQAEQQRQKLSHSNRLNMLGEVTAGIAHELNQPLAAITSRCAAAKNRINRENPDLGKIKEALDSIEEQAIRSGEIIKQLRSLAKTKDNEFQQVN